MSLCNAPFCSCLETRVYPISIKPLRLVSLTHLDMQKLTLWLWHVFWDRSNLCITLTQMRCSCAGKAKRSASKTVCCDTEQSIPLVQETTSSDFNVFFASLIYWYSVEREMPSVEQLSSMEWFRSSTNCLARATLPPVKSFRGRPPTRPLAQHKAMDRTRSWFPLDSLPSRR